MMMNQRTGANASSSNTKSFSVAPKITPWHVGPAFDPTEEEEEKKKRNNNTNKSFGGSGGADPIKSDGLEREEMLGLICETVQDARGDMFRFVGVADAVQADAAQKCGEESWESERETSGTFRNRLKRRGRIRFPHDGLLNVDDALNPREYDNAIKEYEDEERF